MRREWLDGCRTVLLSSNPKWVVEKYFGSEAQPDRTITTTVVEIPFRH